MRRHNGLIDAARAGEALDGLCAHDTPGWEGWPIAKQGVYESVREKGWREIVYCISARQG